MMKDKPGHFSPPAQMCNRDEVNRLFCTLVCSFLFSSHIPHRTLSLSLPLFCLFTLIMSSQDQGGGVVDTETHDSNFSYICIGMTVIAVILAVLKLRHDRKLLAAEKLAAAQTIDPNTLRPSLPRSAPLSAAPATRTRQDSIGITVDEFLPVYSSTVPPTDSSVQVVAMGVSAETTMNGESYEPQEQRRQGEEEEAPPSYTNTADTGTFASTSTTPLDVSIAVP